MEASRSARGTLDRGQLLEGADRLVGDWFAGAYSDDNRRARGIAFPTERERAADRPSSASRLCVSVR